MRSWVVFGLMIVLLLAGCGSVDDDQGSDSEVASLRLITDNTQLQSSGNSPATITAIARNANNVAIEGEPVNFAASSGLLEVSQGTTDGSGQASATLVPGGNPTNRTITVTASSGSTEAKVDVAVSGTTLSLDGPSSLVFGETGTWTVSLQDSDGNGIRGEKVEVTSSEGNSLTSEGNSLSSTSLTTESTGQVQFDMTADASTNTDTLTATAASLSTSVTVDVSGQDFSFTQPDAGAEVDILPNDQMVTIHWENNGNPQTSKTIDFSISRGTFAGSVTSSTTERTDANGDATVIIQSIDAGPATITATGPRGSPSGTQSIEFVATQVDNVTLQADPSTIGTNETSQLTAVVADPNGNLVKNKTINFSLEDKTGGQLTTPRATTDTQGRATTTYEATSTTSAKDGIQVTATEKGTGKSDTANLSVSGQPLNVKLGTGGTIETPTETQYSKTWTVLVTDSNGNPVEGAEVSLSLQPERYRKGGWVKTDTDGDGTADEWAIWSDSVIDGNPNFDNQLPFYCDREDDNLDGDIDGNEDKDGDGFLEPDGAAGVTPQEVTTDQNGFAEVDVVYPQSEAFWSEQTLKATAATEAGSQNTSTATFILWILSDELTDLDNDPPGGSGPGPYGFEGDCTVDYVNN